jgi:hypothetical protein
MAKAREQQAKPAERNMKSTSLTQGLNSERELEREVDAMHCHPDRATHMGGWAGDEVQSE